MVQANLFQRLNKMMMLTKKLPVVLHLRYVWFVCVLSLFSLTVHAQIKLPLFFCDSMILQRDAKINIWGWASANEKVTIKFDGKTYKTKTADDGKWKLQLAPMKAGGPYTMELKGNNKIVLHDILIGDVWVCAGQSNMEHQMKLHAVLYADEIAHANYTEIRQFKVPNTTDLQSPQDNFSSGSWKWANSNDIKDFSAVAYFFAKALYQKYHIPVGIINASWGGIPVEAMMSEDALKDFPSILKTVEKNKDTAYVNEVNRKAFAAMNAGNDNEDKGITGRWFDTSYQPKEWRRIAVPGYWEDQGIKDLDGVVWYRREIDIPASMINQPAKVFLGRIVDADELYINGIKVGSTAYLYPQRRYAVTNGILKPGKNLFVVRVTNNFGKGGFVPDKPYQLIAGNDTLDLTGYWQYKVGQVNRPQHSFINTIALQNQPTALYNSMIAPLVGYNIKGFVWYQGESNTGKPDEYAKLQPAMINDWRKKWQQPDIPFLFVQLPGFMDYNYLPSESQWAMFREAQATSLSVANTGMAVAIDLGEWNDIHPDRKKDVGDRLALAAEKVAYKDSIVYAGPTYQSSAIEGNRITLTFTNTGSGLTTSDGEEPATIAIAGDDKKFVWAHAKIENDKLVVWSDEITSPKYVRYAWADDPSNPNLVNKEGLPAIPFRTDK
jgi:sialate O-acetylesterase